MKEFLVKLALQSIAALIAFLPAIFFFTVKALLAPVGFWQNLAVYWVGGAFLGGLQLFFLAVLALVSFEIWE